MPEYSNYQKKVISRYYENREQIDEQRLGELVTSLYLAKSDKQRQKHWETARDVMTRLGIPETRIDHVVTSADAALLAAVVEDLQRRTRQAPSAGETAGTRCGH